MARALHLTGEAEDYTLLSIDPVALLAGRMLISK
jgi:hypothetical protein